MQKRFRLLIVLVAWGYFANAYAVTCDAGYGYDSSKDSCTRCAQGYASPGGTSACTRCEWPNYANNVGSSACSTDGLTAGYYLNCDAVKACMRTMCPVRSYCPGDGKSHPCRNGKDTFKQGAKSEDECMCDKGEYIDSTGYCTSCPAGKYNSSRGNYTSCDTIPNGSYGTGCSSSGTGCTGSSSCPVGAYCIGGKAISCGENMTSAAGAKSASDCVCLDGYVKNDDGTACIEPPQQTACPYGATKLYIGSSISFNLYQECDTPALHVKLADGICCVNLESGPGAGALNVSYNENIYHTVN